MQIAILGAGSWGIALANLAAENDHPVRLWEYRPEIAEHLGRKRTSDLYLPGIRLQDSIQVTSRLDQAIRDAEMILFVVPTPVVRTVAREVNRIGVTRGAIAVSAAKGIENDSLLRISELIQDLVPGLSANHIAVLSGPSHAEEVSIGIPTAVVVAARHNTIAEEVQTTLMTPRFRIYTSKDMIGVELGGALKNVIAIAAGICDGVGFGDNTKAALQQRGLVEMVRLGRKLGAHPLTFAGLSGMGDLIVTCNSKHSRNRYVGEQIGTGKTLKETLQGMVMVAEGVNTARSIYQMIEKYQVEMPISYQVYQILYEDKDPRQAVVDLMMRDAKPELWG